MTADPTREPDTDPAAELYAEPGAPRWPMLFGPLIAAAGLLVELAIGDRPHTLMWIITGVGLLWLNAVWVYARRRFLRVRVTGTHLTQGQEHLKIADIAAVSDGAPKPGTRVLGGGLTVPRRYEAVPLTLTDGSHVVAWAGDAGALREALAQARKQRVRNSRRE
ncbi:hypothetical protein ACFS2C_01265 [Prauserella oleivorans]|uniref:DUF3093 family protein n=1 Tax=Prauserella oleivorans TaxID=1478153 RepID=A0ABW5W544_9PSEU